MFTKWKHACDLDTVISGRKKNANLSLNESGEIPGSVDLQEKSGQKDETLDQGRSTRDLRQRRPGETQWQETWDLAKQKSRHFSISLKGRLCRLDPEPGLELCPAGSSTWVFWNPPWRSCDHLRLSVLALVRRSWDSNSFLIQTWFPIAVPKQLTSVGPCSKQMPKETRFLCCPHPGLRLLPMPPGHTHSSSVFWKEEEGKQHLDLLSFP